MPRLGTECIGSNDQRPSNYCGCEMTPGGRLRRTTFGLGFHARSLLDHNLAHPYVSRIRVVKSRPLDSLSERKKWQRMLNNPQGDSLFVMFDQPQGDGCYSISA